MPDPVSPPPPDGYAAYVSDRRRTDANYLRALSIFHALLAVFTGAIVAYMIYGFRSMRQAIPAGTEMSRSFAMGMLPFIAVYALAMALNFLSAWCLRRRKAWTFSVVVAGLDLIYFPLGTVLGIFTLIVLLRGSVRDAYDAPPV